MIKFLSGVIGVVSYIMLGLACFVIVILAKSKINNAPIYTNPEFEPYFDMFQADASKFKTPLRLYKLTTIFSDTVPIGVLGYCVPSTNTVVISARAWDRMDFMGRKVLLYHEWGHCALRREHVEQMNPSPYPYCSLSVMHPYIDTINNCYQELEEEYLEELFTNPYNYPTISRRDS